MALAQLSSGSWQCEACGYLHQGALASMSSCSACGAASRASRNLPLAGTTLNGATLVSLPQPSAPPRSPGGTQLLYSDVAALAAESAASAPTPLSPIMDSPSGVGVVCGVFGNPCGSAAKAGLGVRVVSDSKPRQADAAAGPSTVQAAPALTSTSAEPRRSGGVVDGSSATTAFAAIRTASGNEAVVTLASGVGGTSKLPPTLPFPPRLSSAPTCAPAPDSPAMSRASSASTLYEDESSRPVASAQPSSQRTQRAAQGGAQAKAAASRAPQTSQRPLLTTQHWGSAPTGKSTKDAHAMSRAAPGPPPAAPVPFFD